MGLALSTSWNAFHCRDGKKIVAQIQELGFKELELSFNLTPELLKSIASGLPKAKLKVSSLHNYCPIPRGLPLEFALPDCYSLASLDQTQRQRALKYTKISIDTANKFGAGVLVLHCGRVEMKDITRDLIALYAKGAQNSPRFKQLKEDYQRARRRLAGPFLANTLRSLEELNRYARKHGVSLGVETRFYYREIPDFKEIGIILDRFKKSNIYYWHDSGHAQVLENLGFIRRHEDFLAAYSKDMLGIHLHDVKGALDHLAPGQGGIDFRMFKRYLKKNTLKVIEAHYPASSLAVKKGKQYLENVFHAVL